MEIRDKDIEYLENILKGDADNIKLPEDFMDSLRRNIYTAYPRYRQKTPSWQKPLSILAAAIALSFTCLYAGRNASSYKFKTDSYKESSMIGGDTSTASSLQTADIMFSAYELSSKNLLAPLVNNADLIVVGTTMSSGKTYDTKSLEHSNKGFRYGYSYFNFKITESIKGSWTGRYITIMQPGAADYPQDKTGIRNGDRLLLILSKEKDGHNIYYSTAGTRSIFRIENRRRLFPISGDPFLSRYNGISPNVLIKDIKSALKR